jgi:hypothetical protein
LVPLFFGEVFKRPEEAHKLHYLVAAVRDPVQVRQGPPPALAPPPLPSPSAAYTHAPCIRTGAPIATKPCSGISAAASIASQYGAIEVQNSPNYE